MSFSGFTETQISTGTSTNNTPTKQKSSTINKNKPTRQRQYRSTLTAQEQIAPISDDAKLSLPTTNESDNPDLLMNLNAPSKNVIDMGETDVLETSNDDKNEAPSQKAEHVNDQNNVNLDNGISSQDAESVIERQKRIEEENKRKKAAIAKALEDRKNKTDKETQKLQHVQTELQKIDQIVAGDVRLLRKTIEDASYAYMEAQKRYDRAEKEYISAKETLFSSSEKKDQLTAHLASIIQLNEERKAKKLTELMKELDISTV